jgi:thiamine-monophosphate kinase
MQPTASKDPKDRGGHPRRQVPAGIGSGSFTFPLRVDALGERGLIARLKRHFDRTWAAPLPRVSRVNARAAAARLHQEAVRWLPGAPSAAVARRDGPRWVRIGIGDDTAVLRLPWASGRSPRVESAATRRIAFAAEATASHEAPLLLFASDMLIEGVHFRLAPGDRIPRRRADGSARGREVPAEWVGWKALAANLSDVAAMAGVPLWAVVSLGLPPRTPVRVVEALARGLTRCARRFGVAVVGGDTVRAPQLVVDVAIVGAVSPRRLTLRRGAAVGDRLFVTGRLGGSLRSGHHARLTPRLAEAQRLVRLARITAMMDLSDGLASDLWQMSRASHVVLRVAAASLPVAPAARWCVDRRCACRRFLPPVAGRAGVIERAGRGVYHALMDGEDFELLFAVGCDEAARVPRHLGACPVTPIGQAVRRGEGVELERPDGRIVPLIPRGFRHF